MNPRLLIALAAAALLHGIVILLLMPGRSASLEEQLPPGEGQGFEPGEATGSVEEAEPGDSGGVLELELGLDEGAVIAAPRPVLAAKAPRGNLGGGKSYLGLVRAHLNAQRRALAEAPLRPSVARVRFRISEEGKTSEVMLAESSGLSLLDQEALALVSRASPLPPPPDGQALSVVVPVEFR